MEKSMLRDLLDGMSHFHHMFSVNKGKAGPAQIHYQSIAELLILLMPVLNDIIDSEAPCDEQLSRRLEELEFLIDDAKKFMAGWYPLMSSIYSLLQIEVVAEKIYESIQVICRILSSFTLSAASVSNIDHIQDLQNHESVSKNHESSVIREAIKNRRESNLPSSETMVKIADCLSLSSSQELLMEAVALEKAKLEAGHEKKTEEVELIDHLIALVTYMHDCLVKVKQSRTDGVPIPPDFCCPLSLEPMSDPVIVASGQTYERAFIRKWLDMGLTVCPKTRQNLAHTNLIPNFTVKELIANWCELNNVKLPDPVKVINSNQPSMLLARAESLPTDAYLPRSPSTKVLESSMLVASVDLRLSNGSIVEAYPNQNVSSHLDPPRVSDGASVSSSTELSDIENGSGRGLLKKSVHNENGMASLGSLDVNAEHAAPALAENDSSEGGLIDVGVEGYTRSTSVSSAVSSTDVQGEAGDVNEMFNDNTNDNRDASGEVTSMDASSAPPRDSDIPTRLSDFRTRSQPLWRRQSDQSFVPRITSPLPDSRSNTSEVEAQVKRLIEDLQNPSIDIKRSAAIELRHLSKHNMENRIVIGSCGSIKFLVDLLYSTDVKTQENAVTALLNLSINDNNKSAIANAGAIDPLIHVLKTGSPEAKENSAATLFSISVIDENKARIGRSGAIQPLVELLGSGSPRGKKDAATALFNLSICHENKARIVQAGAVRHLVDLMDPAAGMVDKAVAVLSNLSTIPDGRTVIGQEGGIPVLVEVVELGSSRGKENAAAALLQLCTYDSRFSNMVLQEGVVPPLVALSQSGTARAKEKAQNLLGHFRNQRHGNQRRA